MSDPFDFLGGMFGGNSAAPTGSEMLLRAQLRKANDEIAAEKRRSAMLIRKAQRTADIAYNRGVDAALKRAPDDIREAARADLHREVRHEAEFAKGADKP